MYDTHIQAIDHLAQVRGDLGLINSQLLQALSTPSAAQGSPVQSAEAAVDRLMAGYTGNAAAVDAFHADWSRYRAAVHNALAQPAATRSTSVALSIRPVVSLYGVVDGDVARLISTSSSQAAALDANGDAIYTTGRVLVAALLLATLLIGVAISLLLARGIAGPAGQIARASRELARGHLDQHINVRSTDELGQMATSFRSMIEYQKTMAAVADMIARGDLTQDVQPQSERDVLGLAFQRMIANLRALVAELQQGAHNLATAGTEILAATTQLSSGATEQAAAITETTATVDEVTASASQTIQLSSIVGETADQANRVVGDGVAAVGHATTGMADVRQRMQSIAQNILALSEQSQQIGEIIGAVGDLADRSNLLALNAAIEASRAGEHGKGFTVVAQEIRSLAEQSKAATAQVRTILSDIQHAINAAVMATEQGVKGTDAGVDLIARAGQTIDNLAEVIRQAGFSAAQITASVRQHSVGMEQIALAMNNINQATTQNLAATNNTQQAARNLADVAGRLNGLTATYRVQVNHA